MILEGVGWINLAHNKTQLWALVNTIMFSRVDQNAGNLLNI
jgi:hypothetical protein